MANRQVQVRFSAEEFDQLDDKRHAERETWQSVGVRLFREWLRGAHTLPRNPSEFAAVAVGRGTGSLGRITPDEAEFLERILTLLRSGNKDAAKGLKSAVEIGELLVEAFGQGKGRK